MHRRDQSDTSLLVFVPIPCSGVAYRLFSTKQARPLCPRRYHFATELTGGENPIVLGTLATAYAEAGRYREALETVSRAVQLPEVESNPALISALESQLKLYSAQASGQAQ
jgi:hypothetical protein